MGNYLWLILMEMSKSNQGRDISHAKLIMTLPLPKETYLAGFVTVISIYHNLLFIGILSTDAVAENIKRLNESKRPKEYKPGNAAMALPLGRNGGATQLPNGMVAGSFLTKSFKGKDIMTPSFWKLMKQKMPSNWMAELSVNYYGHLK